MSLSKEEQELADKIDALLKEKFAIEQNRDGGCSLDKSNYVEYRGREIDEELKKLKSIKKENPSTND